MRVIAGSARGRPLKSPKGLRLRPTSDLVRGAIFSILEGVTKDWVRVLDLYAGTGALGIEALSRGVEWADFVERDPRACALIRENLVRTELATQARIYCFSVEKALSLLQGRYSIIFLDPSYQDTGLVENLKTLSSSSLVGPATTLVVEHSRRSPLDSAYGGLTLVQSRRHGDTCISIYRKED